MKRTINYLVLVLFATAVLVGCSSEPTLQTYFVDRQEAPNFISQDLPISMLNMDTTKLTEEQLDAFNSVERLNFLGYKANENNTEAMNTEMAKVKSILKHEKYNDLIEFSNKGNKVLVKYVGVDTDADEVILFGNSKKLGFGIVRLLGDDMNPSKMGALVSALKYADIDGEEVKGVMNFFK